MNYLGRFRPLSCIFLVIFLNHSSLWVCVHHCYKKINNNGPSDCREPVAYVLCSGGVLEQCVETA